MSNKKMAEYNVKYKGQSPDPYIYGGIHRINWWKTGCIVLAALLAILAFRACNKPLHGKPDVMPVAAIRDSAKQAQQRHDRRVDSLSNVNKVLANRVDSGKAAMAAIMARVRQLQKRPSTPVHFGPALPRHEHHTPDTGKIVGNEYEAGSPWKIIDEQTDLLFQQDSACKLTVGALEGMVANREAVIVVKDTLINTTRRLLDVTLVNQSTLEAYAKELRKSAKRARRGRSFWRTAAVGLAGVVVYLTVKK